MARARAGETRDRGEGKWLEGRGPGRGRGAEARGEGTAQGARDQWQGTGHAEGGQWTKAQGQARDMARAKGAGGAETDDKGARGKGWEQKGRVQRLARQSRAGGRGR